MSEAEIMLDIPGFSREIECVMSNLDHAIDAKIADELRAAPNEKHAQYAAMNFCGFVWWTGERWACKIMRYHDHVATLQADTLEEIMGEASAQWGSE